MRRISSALVALACGIGTCVDVMAAQVEKLRGRPFARAHRALAVPIMPATRVLGNLYVAAMAIDNERRV